MLLGGAGGSFRPQKTFETSLMPVSVAVGDFDADGRDDLAAADFGTDEVSLLINAATPAIETDRSSLTFAAQAQGTASAVRTLTVLSTGDRALRVRGVRTIGDAGDDYVVADDTCTGEVVTPDGSCTVKVRFLPSQAGPREANLEIISDAPGHPRFDIDLNGTGGALPTGPAGSVGPAGPPVRAGRPAPSPSAREVLVALFAIDRQSAPRRRALALRYVVTAPAAVTVELRRAGRLVRRFAATAKLGRNTLRLRAPAKPGRYTLPLTARAGSQTATDQARLTLRRR